MNTSAELLMRILNAFLYQKCLEPEFMQVFRKNNAGVLYLAKIHNVLGIAGYKVWEYYNRYAPTDPDEKEMFVLSEQLYAMTVSRMVKREFGCQRLLQELENEKIDYIPFKGIVVKDFYAIPELRTFGDIDIIIHKEDRERCHALMLRLGYTAKVDFGEVYSYQKGCEHYEIHTSIMTINITQNGAQKEYFEGLWNHAYQESGHRWKLTPEFHFIYLVAHIAKHIYSSGAGIRMYLDLAFLLKSESEAFNWQWIMKEFENLGLGRFFALTIFCVQKWFGVMVPFKLSEPEREVVADFFDFTMEAGVFGKEGKRQSEAVIRHARFREKRFVRFRALCNVLFPPAEAIRDKYDYIKKHPYLLPVAWVDRCLRNRQRIKNKIGESGEIILAKTQSIEKNTEFYHKIGL
ncbi:nucleotidyltransferase domain-containing protein [Ructibacterium gallinarum]|uniref:Nucleotidyltransferase family protein n=1 Tax=Ructibacterium gallinarum TaxID=2779355 RepID=A0A9D5M4K9_9FIRM|nr:nucleotidyltransferase family protein [Ructibacterium gallinarum]MBE5039332.1 nucleotidyltransferase family protein [Ructibacterium gallinarum]